MQILLVFLHLSLSVKYCSSEQKKMQIILDIILIYMQEYRALCRTYLIDNFLIQGVVQ